MNLNPTNNETITSQKSHSQQRFQLDGKQNQKSILNQTHNDENTNYINKAKVNSLATSRYIVILFVFIVITYMYDFQ